MNTIPYLALLDNTQDCESFIYEDKRLTTAQLS